MASPAHAAPLPAQANPPGPPPPPAFPLPSHAGLAGPPEPHPWNPRRWSLLLGANAAA
jgi:hypothetical protein